MKKQSPGVAAASTGTGDSELRPYRTISRSACSGFVGIPVAGPARWTSMIRSGSSSVTAEPDRLRLQHDSGPGRGADAERTAERRPERRAGGRDLVLGLERPDAEVLVAGELLEDPRGRRDRVGAEEQRQPALASGRDEPERERPVAGDVAVRPGRELGGLDLVRDLEVLARLAVVHAGLEGARVRLGDLGPAWRTSSR